jgi:hypothetical protein
LIGNGSSLILYQGFRTFTVSEHRLMSQFGRVREVVWALISVFLQSEGYRGQYSSAYVVAAITWLRVEGRNVCENSTEGRFVKRRGLYGSNPAIHKNVFNSLAIFNTD